jgi:hypothetical protein
MEHLNNTQGFDFGQNLRLAITQALSKPKYITYMCEKKYTSDKNRYLGNNFQTTRKTVKSTRSTTMEK